MFPHPAYTDIKQQYLIADTASPSLRSEAIGWSFEDISLVDPDQSKPIGLSPSWQRGESCPTFDCVARALANGWRLTGPPYSYQCEIDGETKTYWTWWLSKIESPSGSFL